MADTAALSRKVPTKIRIGQALMIIGCILFFFNALGNALDFILAVSYKAFADVPQVGEELVRTYDAIWSDPIAVIKYVSIPFIIVFLIVAGIGGISWVRDKGPFISIAPLMAIISLVLIVCNLYLDIRRLVMNGWNWTQFFIDILDIQLTCGIYFIGWMIAKNQID